MSRPLGVTILALIAGVIGVWNLLKGLVFLGLGGALATMLGVAFPVAGILTLGLAAAFGVAALVVGIFSLAFAVGAWRLRPWGWKLGVATQVLAFCWSFILILLGPATFRDNLWDLLIPAALWFYLTRPAVKRAFGLA